MCVFCFPLYVYACVCVCKSIFIKRARCLQWRRAIKNQIALPATVPSSSRCGGSNNNNLNLFKVQLAAVAPRLCFRFLLVPLPPSLLLSVSTSLSRASRVEWALVLNLALPLLLPLSTWCWRSPMRPASLNCCANARRRCRRRRRCCCRAYRKCNRN